MTAKTEWLTRVPAFVAAIVDDHELSLEDRLAVLALLSERATVQWRVATEARDAADPAGRRTRYDRWHKEQDGT